MVEVLVAFVGGVLSLLSPCSALLLPAFFAYAFPSPARLAQRTAIFYAGMLTLLLPLGVGAGALGSVLIAQRGALMMLAGLVLVVIGIVQFVRGGFELPVPSGGTATTMTPERAASTYALGLGFGLGGFCAGPILGGVLTIAASSGGALSGAALLAAYAGASRRGRLRGREVRILGLERHITVVVSSAMFVVLGLVFIVLEGANPAAGIYDALGLADLSVALQTALLDATSGMTPAIPAVLGLAAASGAFILVRRRRSRAAG
ncbi:MAG: cytochrome c biogenesis CcdA family protein [Candidatus Limnocylindrales bacterium]